MSQKAKLIMRILNGTSDNNIQFDELCNLLLYFNFMLRTKGSHHIFYKDDIEEIINIQPKKDGNAKAYQVRHIRDIFLKYELGGKIDA